MRAKASPPMPVEHGSTTQRVATVAMAASTALPPAFSTFRPAWAANGWLVATIPLWAIMLDLRLGKWKVSKFIGDFLKKSYQMFQGKIYLDTEQVFVYTPPRTNERLS
jgi:hypothetical protein